MTALKEKKEQKNAFFVAVSFSTDHFSDAVGNEETGKQRDGNEQWSHYGGDAPKLVLSHNISYY